MMRSITLITGPSEIVVPFLNAMFPERDPIPEDAILEQERNEFLINKPENLESDGDGERRTRRQRRVITDSNLRYGKRFFHLECQSTPDGTMLIRMFEYDAQIALAHRVLHDGVLDVFFPESGVLYVRESGKSPNKLKVRIHTSGTNAEYEVKTLRVRDYNEKELLERDLVMLIPFFPCNYEKDFSAFEQNPGLRRRFEEKLLSLINGLNERNEAGRLSDYGYAIVTEVLQRLIEYETREFRKLHDETEAMMGGKVMDLKATRIYNKGRVEGKAEGKAEGGLSMLYELAASGDLPIKSAVEKAKEFGVRDEKDFRKRALLLNIRIQPGSE